MSYPRDWDWLPCMHQYVIVDCRSAERSKIIFKSRDTLLCFNHVTKRIKFVISSVLLVDFMFYLLLLSFLVYGLLPFYFYLFIFFNFASFFQLQLLYSCLSQSICSYYLFSFLNPMSVEINVNYNQFLFIIIFVL